ncbi:MAG TPA: carboxylesterase family protein [Hyphomicrobiales bacterium]|nr:carboxylesterase family protein [Hyphomicrobiales bacterium]
MANIGAGIAAEGAAPGLGVVQTSAGAVSGADAGHGVTVYKGLPYAAPATGALRWRPPAPATPWSGVRAMTDWPPDCPQGKGQTSDGYRSTRQGEDCLAVNVWTPARAPGETLPVMVWFYGGSFIFGSGSDERSDGTGFARKGVVLVTVNYRLGLFGFLAHPALTAESAEGFSGNYGVLDIIAALRWIRDNIAGFGGDPDRVTLFGVSAGAAQISLLLTAPGAAGLFQRAIMESPGAMRPLATLAEAEEAGRVLGDDIAALRRLPWQELLAKTNLLVPKMRALTHPRVLRPIADGVVIPEDDRTAFRAGHFHPVPSIVGTNADEGTSMVATWTVKTAADWHRLLADNFAGAEAAVAAAYPVAVDADVPGRVAEAFADSQFNYGAEGVARALVARGAPVWRYRFIRRAPYLADGPHHGGEVSYVFNNLPDGPDYDATDRALAATMQDIWVRFATAADPNGSGLPSWPRQDAGADNRLLIFGDRIAATTEPPSARLAVYDQVYDSRA